MTDAIEQVDATEPDYVRARRELETKVVALGYTLTAEPVWTRLFRLPQVTRESSRPDQQDPVSGPDRPFHVRYTLRHEKQDKYGSTKRELAGYYSAGYMIPLRWAQDPANRASLKQMEPTSSSDLARIGQSGGLTIHDVEVLNRLRKVWRPSLVDIVSSLLSDCASFELGL